jgi:signal transduction histidine kinase
MSMLTNEINPGEHEAAGEDGITPRERELGAIIRAYSEVTELLKDSHEQLKHEVGRLREELSGMNRQLRRRERLAALGEMAAGVAHEIRNPLGGIQMFASLLHRDLADRPEAGRLVGKIIRGVERLDRVVTDTLEFGRVAEPQPASVDLGTLIRDTVELAAARIAETGVAVELPADGGIRIVTDPALLQRALLNVLVNAVEAAPAEGGRVEIGLRMGPNERVILTVSDNGPGISPDCMDRIFNPFFTTKGAGTGLGLAIVHQIVESLGGSVQAANRSGGGAVFSLSLPRVAGVTG